MNYGKEYKTYEKYKKPKWAPPSWIFGPVWSVLYVLIAISFGAVGMMWMSGQISSDVALPFLLNLGFNIIFTPIQFGLRNFALAAVDVVMVWITLVWALIVIHPYAEWITLINLPYLLWVSFASVLQLTVTAMNPKFRG